MAARGEVLSCAAVLGCVLVAAALTSEAQDWQPVTLVVALAALMIVADLAVVMSRRLRMSSGLMVQTIAMALLGPAPAVAIGVVSILVVDALIYRVELPRVLANLLIVAGLGLVGGVMFETLGDAFGVDSGDPEYALLVAPVYAVLVLFNIALLLLTHPHFGRPSRNRARLVMQSSMPLLPLELVNGVFATAIVLVWEESGVAATAGVLALLVLVIPLTRLVTDLLAGSDDSDERAAEVTRLASDRERLLSEVVDAEERERGRLAESLHDGPMQRLMALRQDAAETDAAMLGGLDAAIAETRAIISAFHPETAQELGFEGALRAAIAPFPAARTVALSVEGARRDEPLLLRIAQELVVNAVRHARPTRIDVRATCEDGVLVLEVDDDGIGIDASDGDGTIQAGHLGLAMVRRRVEDAGGQFEIATRRDGGTHSVVVLPDR